MFTMLAVVAYLAALAISLLLLKRFGAVHWSWHVLCILAALGLGLTPSSLQGPAVDLAFGFVFILLMVWGIGGIVAFHPHGHTHRHA